MTQIKRFNASWPPLVHGDEFLGGSPLPFKTGRHLFPQSQPQFAAKITSAMNKNYGVRPGYISRTRVEYYSDTHNTMASKVVWQPEVYTLARQAASALKCRTLIDVGCGSAAKLVANGDGFNLIGVDYGANLAHCRTAHPHVRWIEADFEVCRSLEIPSDELKESLIICSDVIEHLVNPEPLLRLLGSLLRDSKLAIISTPERNLLRGWADLGPPKNPHHIREWTLSEFRRFALQQSLALAYAGLTITNNESPERNTIMLIALGNSEASTLEILKRNKLFPQRPGFFSYSYRTLLSTYHNWRQHRAQSDR